MSNPRPDKDPLLPLRSVVVLLFAMLIGSAAGGLTYLSSGHNMAVAIIAAGTAFAGAVIWLDTVIAP
ncbi:hypothetical protein [Mycobacterium colombiense]|uniref:hypothetical protein n=1 Tax=Mycobacterium colombiense TaxID=339268 RepID=UPI000ACD3474|nr:hypothetical protein [Mycobacterium colombiense]